MEFLPSSLSSHIALHRSLPAQKAEPPETGAINHEGSLLYFIVEKIIRYEDQTAERICTKQQT